MQRQERHAHGASAVIVAAGFVIEAVLAAR
jgi:hypothetical protein